MANSTAAGEIAVVSAVTAPSVAHKRRAGRRGAAAVTEGGCQSRRLLVAIKTEMVTRLRSRGDNSGRLHTSLKSTRR